MLTVRRILFCALFWLIVCLLLVYIPYLGLRAKDWWPSGIYLGSVFAWLFVMVSGGRYKTALGCEVDGNRITFYFGVSHSVHSLGDIRQVSVLPVRPGLVWNRSGRVSPTLLPELWTFKVAGRKKAVQVPAKWINKPPARFVAADVEKVPWDVMFPRRPRFLTLAEQVLLVLFASSAFYMLGRHLS